VLNHAGFLAVSSDNRHLYVNAPNSNAISVNVDTYDQAGSDDSYQRTIPARRV
jgi:hypothetical protein